MPLRFLRQLGFRNRILLALLLLGAAPSAILSAGWVWSLLQYNPARSSRFVLDTVRVTGQSLLETLDSSRLREPKNPADSVPFTTRESAALDEHVKAINVALITSESGFHYARLRAIALAVVIALLGLFLITAAVYLARSIARGLSRPTDELVGWMEKIRRHETLPPESPESGVRSRESGAPEFATLRAALRETAVALQQGRAAELESERLRAFREVARRVAHEMKNPLTPIRFAIGQLERSARRLAGSAAETGRAGTEDQEALEVLRVETGRLEQLAREFANLGRLPEGPAAEVDLGELLAELLRTSVPETMQPVLRVDAAAPRIVGHYDPLHRAFTNLIRNAVEASREQGSLEVTVGIEEAPDGGILGVRVTVADHGPGVIPEERSRIFEPYVTHKPGGTGLGLALVKQAIEFHRGTIEVIGTPAGGATFVVRLPMTRRTT